MPENRRYNRDETFGNDDLGPLTNGTAVTPNDNVDLAEVSRAILCGTAGNVKVTFISGDVLTMECDAKLMYPISVKRIWSTGTTAGNIVSFR